MTALKLEIRGGTNDDSLGSGTPLAAKVVGMLLMAGVVLVGVSRVIWNRSTRQALKVLRTPMQSAGADALAAYTPVDLAELPPPVARYFMFALPAGQPRLKTARITWRGEFRSRADCGWARFTAEQHVTSAPPGFVWDARIRMLPWLQVRVRDSYSHGEGTMLGRVAAIVPVVDQEGTPEMAQSALARWLGEAVWVPTALLPGSVVQWEAMDDSTARATARDGNVVAVAEFHFGRSGEVLRMTAMRFRDVNGKAVLTPFEGRYGSFERRSGVMVPGHAEVAWELPEGRFPYWRGRLDSIDYEVPPGELSPPDHQSFQKEP